MRIRTRVEMPHHILDMQPILDEIQSRGHELIITYNSGKKEKKEEEISDKNSGYIPQKADWGITFDTVRGKKHVNKKAIFYHGTVPFKETLDKRDPAECDVWFVESEDRKRRILELNEKAQNIPIVVTGSPKLDYAKAIDPQQWKERLGISGKTILYAPTYFPTSFITGGKYNEVVRDQLFELYKDGWNVILRLHYYIWANLFCTCDIAPAIRAYAKWARILAPTDQHLVPYYSCADLVISDNSTVGLEAAWLGKPVIFLDGSFIPDHYRTERYLTYRKVGTVCSPIDLREMAPKAIPRGKGSKFLNQFDDGKSAERVIRYMENNI